MTSMCKSPRYPQRNPKPRATELSGSYVKEASFKLSFSSAERSSPYSSASIGKSPPKTTDLVSLNPSRGSFAGVKAKVTVSPIFTSFKFLIAAEKYPTSPLFKQSTSFGYGVKTPVLYTS